MARRQREPEQIELFTRSKSIFRKKLEKDQARQHFSVNLSIDNIVIIFISIILGFVFSFSLGVEKGRKIGVNSIAKQTILQQVTKQDDEAAHNKQEYLKKTKRESVDKQKVKTVQFTVQVATYKKGSYVQKEVQRLEKQGYETIVVPKGKFIELCVGNFSDKNKAKVAWKQLRKRYQDCFIRRL
jgi:hypothetical protein